MSFRASVGGSPVRSGLSPWILSEGGSGVSAEKVGLGVQYLEEAVMEVLLEAAQGDECLGPAEVTLRAGLYRGTFLKNAIAAGTLNKLLEDGRVVRCIQANGRGAGRQQRLTRTVSRECLIRTKRPREQMTRIGGCAGCRLAEHTGEIECRRTRLRERLS